MCFSLWHHKDYISGAARLGLFSKVPGPIGRILVVRSILAKPEFHLSPLWRKCRNLPGKWLCQATDVIAVVLVVAAAPEAAAFLIEVAWRSEIMELPASSSCLFFPILHAAAS